MKIRLNIISLNLSILYLSFILLYILHNPHNVKNTVWTTKKSDFALLTRVEIFLFSTSLISL